MNAILLVAGAALLALTVGAFALGRRRARSGPDNNWRNQAYVAREMDGSWTENECAVGHEDAAPPSIFPGLVP
jgi:hypothetical protein